MVTKSVFNNWMTFLTSGCLWLTGDMHFVGDLSHMGQLHQHSPPSISRVGK